MTGEQLTERWDASIKQIRLLINYAGGWIVAVAGYYGTNNSVFAVFYPAHVWRRYHNDNHEKRA